MSTSRERKARLYDGLAVALVVLFAAVFGGAVALASAPHAKAQPSSDVVAYTAVYGGVVCEVLDEYPSFPGIIGIAQGITQDGFTMEEAGEVIGISVMEICPRHTGLMLRFIDAFANTGRYIA